VGILDAAFKARVSLESGWNGRPLWQRLAAVFLVSTFFAIGGRVSGVVGDCSPHEIDGQCGMSTFVGTFCGLAMGSIGIITTLMQWNATKNRKME
jgi:hypothetical protein